MTTRQIEKELQRQTVLFEKACMQGNMVATIKFENFAKQWFKEYAELNLRSGKPLSRKTVVHHLSFISDVLAYAVKMDMLSENPCAKVSVPKGEKKEKEIYTLEEVEQLFVLLEKAPIKYRVFFTLAIYSGFRRGELLGLEWKDVVFDNNVISVRCTSNYTKDRGTYTDTTKTKKSQRSLKFPQLVMDLLRDYKSVQDNGSASGRAYRGRSISVMQSTV